MEGRFDGGEVSSDGGLVLMREVDRRLGLIKSVARRLGDARQKGKVRHGVETLVRQRVMGLCAGWEDLNDVAGGRGVERAEVADRALAENAAHTVHDVVRGEPWRLIEDENRVHRICNL